MALVIATMAAFAASPATRANDADAPTSLAGYLERALAANPDLKAFSARYDAARARIPQATALPDPMLQITHFVESIQTRTGPQDNIFMVSQRLPWFGRLRGRGDAAGAEAEAIFHAFQARQLMLARMVGTGYFDYAYTGRAIELTSKNLALLERLAPQVEERARTGGNLNSLLRLQVEIGRLRDRLATLEQRRPQLSARLAAQLDLPADAILPWPEWSAEGSLPEDAPGPDSILAAIETNNPELLMLERKIESARARVELARLEARPDFTLGVTYVQLGDQPAASTMPGGPDPWSVTVAVNLPIWGGRTSAARREADASELSTQRELADRRNQLRADAHVALSSFSDARRRISLYEDELLPLARQAVDNTLSAYQADRATLLELIDSERSQLDLELLLWRAHADAAQQQVILQTLTNQPLTGALVAP